MKGGAVVGDLTRSELVEAVLSIQLSKVPDA